MSTILLANFSFKWELDPLALVAFLVVLGLFVFMLFINRMVVHRIRNRMAKVDMTSNIMQQALKTSENNVVRYDINGRYIYRLYGKLFPEEGLSVDDWKKHLDPNEADEVLEHFRCISRGESDREEFYYRWNFDLSGKNPRWGHMHNISVPEYKPGRTLPVSIISTLHDETELLEQEQRESELADRYKLIFENSIIGLSFYSPDGWLLDANKMMRELCHFDSSDGDSYFSNLNLFESSPFRECIDRNDIQELWICSQSVIPERNIHDYLEIRLHPIRDEQGSIVYIAVATRNVTEERELYLRIRLNDAEIQKANERIMAYESELQYMMEACDMRAWRMSFADRKVQFYKGLSTVESEMTFEEIRDHFVNIPEEVAKGFKDPYKYFNHPMSYAAEMLPVFHDSNEAQWNQINNIPIYDDDGNAIGAFGLIRNTSSMMRKQEQLKRETERANDSGRLKSVFLANMTHEIRTPLNAIVGFSDLLQAIDSPDDRREMIRVIHNNCDMLLRLINDILVLSNVDANAMEIVPAQVDFAREFDNICQTLAQRVQEPGVEFQKDNPCETLPVYIDNGRIQQVITNFVTNAVKYTQQGHIRVGYRPEERDGRKGLYVYCEDTGTGIPKDQCERVFERFVKLNDFIQGTGLGLSICKAIVEKCGGSIGVDSEVGQGSTFWFWIPV